MSAAARRSGRQVDKPCPSCSQPLVELRGPEIEIEPKVDVCLRCHVVWLEREALASLLPASAASPGKGAVAHAQIQAVSGTHSAVAAREPGAADMLASAVLRALGHQD